MVRRSGASTLVVTASVLLMLACAPALAGVAGAVTLGLDPVIAGLASPDAIAHAGDGSGRLFVAEQRGRIIVFGGATPQPAVFLDISGLVSCCGERGLLGLAFHPRFRTNGLFYVNYTNAAGDTVIARYTASPGANAADPGSAVILLTVAQPFANHNGGQLEFGPDGYLYIGLGDGGSGGDPGNRAQNLGELLGKILRIDVDGGIPYAVPPTNPFLGVPGARAEIWAYGLRNPWRFSFDRATGDLLIGDVGQNSREEVDFQPGGSGGGQNYGWRRMEGTACFNPGTGCNDGSLVLPIIEYDRSGGCSIIGGYRYRGAQFPALAGIYLYGDFCSGTIWGATPGAGGAWRTTQLLATALAISAFGQDESGELYVADYSAGVVYRISAASDTAAAVVGRNVVEASAFVTTLYTVALGRSPAASEGAGWVAFLSANPGVPGAAAVARGFLGSAEFQARALTVPDRIAVLYGAILGRASSAPEQAGWVPAVLDAFDPLVTGFVGSAEFRVRLAGESTAGIVTRLYRELLGRDASPAEIGAWVEFVVATGDWESVIRGFVTSAEYLSTARTLARHVELLYRSLLARQPAPVETSGWVAVLVARLAIVTEAFLASPEFQQRAAALTR